MQIAGVQTRQLIVSLIIMVVLAFAAYGWIALRAPAEGPNRYNISMTDYNFSPSEMTWRVGQTVTLSLINNSPDQPGKQHEFMVGRTPMTQETVLGKVQSDGFMQSFFTGVTVRLEGGYGLQMIAPGSARLTGVDPQKLLMPGMQGMTGMTGMQGAEMSEFMSVLMPGGQLSFSFTVPNKPGRWTFACFQQNGQHYLNGMQGVVNVVPAT